MDGVSYQAGDFGAKLDSFERWSRGIQSAVNTAATAIGGAVAWRGVFGRTATIGANMAKGRLDGRILTEKQLAGLERGLGKHGVKLVRDADKYLDRSGSAARFVGNNRGKGKLYIRNNATRYEVLHELGHFKDWRKGWKQFEALGEVGREQSVYDYLTRPSIWKSLTKKEQNDAFAYILSKGGNPVKRK